LINRTIFRHTLKSNLKLWILFAAVTSLIMAIFVAVFKPSTISGVMDLIKDSALAGIVINTTFLGMLSSTFYTMHGVLLPLVYIIFTANGLIAAQVDRGSMAYVLSAPVRRSTLVLTQGLYLIVALAGMCTVITLVGLAAIRLFQSDIEVDVADFLLVNLGLSFAPVCHERHLVPVFLRVQSVPAFRRARGRHSDCVFPVRSHELSQRGPGVFQVFYDQHAV